MAFDTVWNEPSRTRAPSDQQPVCVGVKLTWPFERIVAPGGPPIELSYDHVYGGVPEASSTAS